ncbi:MAG: CRISPR-associated endonuclease Cas2 [Desulfurococcaceae archaeon]
MLVLIVYDISDNARRNDLANYLKAKGFARIQRSAFLGRPPPHVLRDVERAMQRFVGGGSDVIHEFPIYESAAGQIKWWGRPLAEIGAQRGLLVIY